MSRRLFAISLIVGIAIGGAYLVGRQEAPVPEPPTVRITSQEVLDSLNPQPDRPARTPQPTPRNTPVPRGMPYQEFGLHAANALLEIAGSIDDVVTAGQTYDTVGMASAAGRVADQANAELIWLNGIDAQACYQVAVDSFRTMLTATVSAYRNTEIALIGLDVDALNAASAQMVVATSLIVAAHDSLDAVTC